MKKQFSVESRNTVSVVSGRVAMGVIGSLALAAFSVSAPAQQPQSDQQTQPTQLASNANSPVNPASALPLPVAANSSGPVLNSSLNSLDGAEPAVGATPVIETSGPLHTCDDGISASLQQDAPNMPCWANIRTVDHWNSMFIPEGVAFHESDESQIPADVPSTFGYTAGGMSAYEFPGSPQIKVYGGLIAGAGLIEKHTWQMMIEDAAGFGDAQYQGASFAGLNRFAARGTGEITPRWTWQANATDTYGTDALRTFAPLDYRMIGESEAPAPDTVAYGLHSGNVLNQEEGVKLRFAGTERSHWDFSAGDDYRKFTDDGFSVQTIRGRAEYLHALTRNTAVGFFGEGDHQTNSLDCSLGGGGARLLTEWNSHASLNVSGGVYGAAASCGKSVQFQGDAALYVPVADKTDVYISANRGLGDGAVERAVFLDSASVGLRHTFQRQLAARLSGTALYGTDPANNTSLHGSFSEASIRYPLPMGFSQETAVRHYSVSGFAAPPNRTLAVITFWWSPQKHRSASN
jgi:hypothetical protein